MAKGKRKEKLKRMAQKGHSDTRVSGYWDSQSADMSSGNGGGQSGHYVKYGDVNPSGVHEGSATYGGSTFEDKIGTDRAAYARAVKRGYSKDNFVFQGKLYQIDNAGGTAHSLVKV